MGTIYNVPISWQRDSSKPSWKEAYIGTIGLSYSAGNVINATWGNLSGQGVTKYDDITLYWNYIDIDGVLTQGDAVKTAQYYVSGKYYPNGQTYSYNVDFKEPLIQASTYKVALCDDQGMFDTNKMTKPSTFPLDVTSITVEKVRNINVIGNKIYEDININFELTSNNTVSFSVKQAGIEVYKGSTTGRTITIPKGTLKTTDSLSVEITTSMNFLGNVFTSDIVKQSVSGLQTVVAEKPTNVRLVGTQKAIEENISFAWDTTEPLCRGNVEIWQDGAKVTGQTGIANKQYILLAGTLKNANSIKVRVSNTLTINGYTNTSAYTELTVSDLKSVKPVVSEFVLGSNNADYPINATITATNAERYEIYKGDSLIASGETKTLVIPEGALIKGRQSLKAVALKNSSAGMLRGELTKSFDIVHDEPLIYSIEPSNININIDELVLVSFATNKFIDRWELFINSVSFTTGTVEREIPVSAGIFKAGNNTLKVVAYYSPKHDSGQVRTYTKEVTFTGFGKPQTPVLDANSIYDSATPTFTWTTGTSENDKQTAFEIEVHTESKTVNSTEPRYTVTEPLENEQDYTVRLRIKNKYEMWSDWAEKEFRTVFSQLPRPVISLSPQKENVLIMIECDNVATFEKMVIYRSTDRKNWIEIANDLNITDSLIDFMVQGGMETYYKARIYDNLGGYNDSEVKSITINLVNYNLLNVQDVKSNKRLDFVAIDFKNNFTSVTKVFAGASKPTFYKSNSNYLTANMTVKLVNEEVNAFIDYISNGTIFCYRDYKGKKMFVAIDMTAINYINPFMQEIVLNLTEVNFNEKLAGNKSNYASIVYLDGAYYLDGGMDLTGWRLDL